MGRGSAPTHTISGIDIALWDILGKAADMPVGRLLGGCYRRRVLPYCSLPMEEPPQNTLSAQVRHGSGLPSDPGTGHSAWRGAAG
jgi:D-galactarolactone cycloisomerase